MKTFLTLIAALISINIMNAKADRYYNIIPEMSYYRDRFLLFRFKTITYQSCLLTAELNDTNSNIIVIEKLPVKDSRSNQVFLCSAYTSDPWENATMVKKNNSDIYLYGIYFIFVKNYLHSLIFTFIKLTTQQNQVRL